MKKTEAILLLNMGGPNNLHEVELFLKNMFNDKNILTMKSSLLRKFIATMITFTRTEKSQEIYRQIGGKSPLVALTQKLVAKLQERAEESVMVDFVMRYTPPFADEVIERLGEQSIENIYLIPLYPQYSTTTTKSSLEDFYERYHAMGGRAIVHEVKHFFQNQSYNQALIERIMEQLSLEEANEFELIFSAHGLPQKIVDAGDVYEIHVQKHVALLEEMLSSMGVHFAKVHLAYQSKVGPMQWLSPSLEEKLHEVESKKVIISPLAFTIDNSETDFELEIEYREVAEELGFEAYKVARCLNDSELFVDALLEIYHKMK